MDMERLLAALSSKLEGELHYDRLWKALYATDASVYRELPLAASIPKTKDDLLKLIEFATIHGITLIPRAAGTSLAGQCTGSGLVVDISKHFTKVLEIDTQQGLVTIQPGVIRDDLNRMLKKHGLFFGPNTSTSNRCMIGGMVGNNSSGTTSIKYGTTRDRIKSLKVLLSDGSEVTFEELSHREYQEKLNTNGLEGDIYRKLHQVLILEENQLAIESNYPPLELHRRNTGYALDELLNTQVYKGRDKKINLCDLIAGSEGTLAFITEITLKLDPLPPVKSAMVAAHFHTIEACMQAVVPAMEHSLFTCEMMDKVILDCTGDNLKYRENRFFIQEDPQAILMLELRANSEQVLEEKLKLLMDTLEDTQLGYAYPVLYGAQIELALDLRKAGLGLLGNMKGDRKAVACIEDTAVAIPHLASYISEFTDIMKKYDQQAVYYAHAGAGEIHLRPILNLKKTSDVALFKNITLDVAHLVKKYNGSLSGEHGDGRLRAEFIALMYGDKVYALLKEVKHVFDPAGIFNLGKIVDAPPMDSSLRYLPNRKEPAIETLMDFSEAEGILKVSEKCNGSGDCRKSTEAGGTMCPSYRATRDEKDTTRARANALREFLTNSPQENKFDHQELKEVMDLCISCKGCKSECPSNVDMAALKSEFQYKFHKSNRPSLRDRAFAGISRQNKLASKAPGLSRFFMQNKLSSRVLKNFLGVAQERELPLIAKTTLKKFYDDHKIELEVQNPIKTVFLFNDEFTNFMDVEVGVHALNLLSKLHYQVKVIDHPESGRSYISKGFLDEAKQLANKNIDIFKDIISEEHPLLGIEPSAILSFRDEYLRLANNRSSAENLAKNCYLIEEFLKQELALGNISKDNFTKEAATVKIHAHCHQKALSNNSSTFDVLNIPENFKVTIIASGCCGMAGSFGYEKEHYAISMQIGESSLFPAVRKSHLNTIIAANGTSCRHQLKDGTSRTAQHPVSILYKALV